MCGVAYAAMGTVSSSPLLRGLVDLNMGDQEVGSIQALGIGISFSVAKQTEKELGGLLGPASTRNTKLFAYANVAVSLLNEMKAI